MYKYEAVKITGSLSRPSKLPGKAYGLPAKKCKVGSKLRKVKGSTCEKCYALKGMYVFPVVQEAQYRRFKSLKNPLWVPAMVKLVSGQKHFRWHDSGDLQGVWHLCNIVEVCLQTPATKHWLPTRESKVVMDFVKEGGIIPKNLVVRISANMIDKPANWIFRNTSTVHTGKPIGRECPAYKQGGKCGSCRACWNPRIKNVSYKKH